MKKILIIVMSVLLMLCSPYQVMAADEDAAYVEDDMYRYYNLTIVGDGHKYSYYSQITYTVGIPLDVKDYIHPIFVISGNGYDESSATEFYLAMYFVDSRDGKMYGQSNTRFGVDKSNKIYKSPFYGGTVDALGIDYFYSGDYICTNETSEPNILKNECQFTFWTEKATYGIEGNMDWVFFAGSGGLNNYFNSSYEDLWTNRWDREGQYDASLVFDYINVELDDSGVAFINYGIDSAIGSGVSLGVDVIFDTLYSGGISAFANYSIERGASGFYTNSSGASCVRYFYPVSRSMQTHFDKLLEYGSNKTLKASNHMLSQLTYRLQVIDKIGNYGPTYLVTISVSGQVHIFCLQDENNESTMYDLGLGYFIRDLKDDNQYVTDGGIGGGNGSGVVLEKPEFDWSIEGVDDFFLFIPRFFAYLGQLVVYFFKLMMNALGEFPQMLGYLFAFIPAEIVALISMGIVAIIVLRILGR